MSHPYYILQTVLTVNGGITCRPDGSGISGKPLVRRGDTLMFALGDARAQSLNVDASVLSRDLSRGLSSGFGPMSGRANGLWRRGIGRLQRVARQSNQRARRSRCDGVRRRGTQRTILHCRPSMKDCHGGQSQGSEHHSQKPSFGHD